MASNYPVCAVGAGRMGRGIAIAYALRGKRVAIIDFKPRSQQQYQELHTAITGELTLTFTQLAELGLFPLAEVSNYLKNIGIFSVEQADMLLANCQLVYEGVPETLEAKQDALGRISQYVAPDAIIASTTSTILASDLAKLTSHPQRFVNAHWLNPAYLVPLVEISAHEGTSEQTVNTLKANLEAIGKVPVECGCSPGYIVPRLQTLVMNEAARMVEEGVATAEDIDKATRYGLGFRFAAIGVLEFIDYGGNDILYHASNYLAENISAKRFTMPDIVRQHMDEGKIGLRTASGFLSYEGLDLAAYRRDVLSRVLAMLQLVDPQQTEVSSTKTEGNHE